MLVPELETLKTEYASLVKATDEPYMAAVNPSAGDVMSVKLPGGVVMKFCYCPPGSFQMGSPPDEMDRQGNETPVKVQLSNGFWMARTECTQAQWVAVMGSYLSRRTSARL